MKTITITQNPLDRSHQWNYKGFKYHQEIVELWQWFLRVAPVAMNPDLDVCTGIIITVDDLGNPDYELIPKGCGGAVGLAEWAYQDYIKDIVTAPEVSRKRLELPNNRQIDDLLRL